MKSRKLFAHLATAIAYIFSMTSILSAADNSDVQDGSRFDQELNERDFEALKKYLNTKRQSPLEEKDDTLAISGDVRFEYRHMNEKLNGHILRGHHARHPERNFPISRNDFDCEFNLKFDYVMDRSWAVAHLQFDNPAGVDSQDRSCSEDPRGWFGSGRCDEICLRKAYMGYNFWMDPKSRFDIELGRRGNLYHVFDSRVQFLSRFDGVLLKWNGKFFDSKDIFVKLGGLSVDERVNHFAYIVELGALDIMGSGFDLKYSFIDWCGQVPNRCIKRKCDSSNRVAVGDTIINKDAPDTKAVAASAATGNPYGYASLNSGRSFDFAVSQWTIYYHLDPCYLGKPAKFFAAFLMNHKKKDFTVTAYSFDQKETSSDYKCRANLAWYAGVAIGEVVKEGDWALELQYQYVQALAMPGQDTSGISNGNVLDYTYTQNTPVYLNSPPYIDNTNYKGWKLEGLYALTDNITLDTILERTTPVNEKIGGSHVYSKIEVEAIYAF